MEVGNHRSPNAPQVDAPVAVETPILDCDERCRRLRVELGDIDRRFLERPPQGNRSSFAAQHQQRGIRERLERA